MATLDIIARFQNQASSEVKRLRGDVKGATESFGQMALKEQLAADKSRLFKRAIQDLAQQVDKGTTSFKDAQRQADKLAQDFGQVAQQTQKNNLRWTEMASKMSLVRQGFETVAEGARIAYQFVGEGADLELARSKFDNLAVSINTTSDSLLTKLRAATNGMQSDAQLIAGATDIINLGLASTEKGTVRLATAVGTLGLDMQQVVLTFANNSKARLDALGLSVEDVNNKVAQLNREGFDGDAFDEAVLIALEEKMALLGDASQTTAGQLQQLESNWENLTNRWKQDAANVMGPIIAETVRLQDAQEILRQAYERGLITNTEYAKAQNDVKIRNQEVGEALLNYGVIVDETGQIVGVMTEEGEKLTAQQEKQIAVTQELNEEAIAYSQALAEARGPNEELSDKIQQTSNRLSEEEAALVRAQQGVDALSEAAGHGAAQNASYAGSFDEVTGNAGTASQEVESLSSRLAGLPSEISTRYDFEAFGLNTLERAQQLLNSLQNPMGPGADPYGGETPGESNPNNVNQGDQFDQGGRFNNEGAASSSSVGGGGPGVNEFFVGTGGWRTVPGPTGAPYPVTLHGGERFNVQSLNDSLSGRPVGGGASGGASELRLTLINPQFYGVADAGSLLDELEALAG